MFVQSALAIEIESLCRILQVPPEEVQHAIFETSYIATTGYPQFDQQLIVPSGKVFLITHLDLIGLPRDASGTEVLPHSKPYPYLDGFEFTFLIDGVQRMTKTELQSIGNVWIVLPSGPATVRISFPLQTLTFRINVAAHGFLLPAETQGLLETMKTMFL